MAEQGVVKGVSKVDHLEHKISKRSDIFFLVCAGNTAAETAKAINKYYPEDDEINAVYVSSLKFRHKKEFLELKDNFKAEQIAKFAGAGARVAQYLEYLLERLERPETVKIKDVAVTVKVMRDLHDLRKAIESDTGGGAIVPPKQVEEIEGTVKKLLKSKCEDKK